MKRVKMDLVTLQVSLVGGAVWAFLGRWLQQRYMGTMWSTWVVAFYFGGMALLMIPSFYMGYAINGYSKPKREDRNKAWLLILAVTVAAGLMELTYELTASRGEKTTSYVFVVDCSSSIQDPQESRRTAIQKLCSEMPAKTPCAVFGFADGSEKIAPFTPAGELANTKLSFYEGWKTNYAAGLNSAMDAIAANPELAGKSPRIVLMSDGYNSEPGLEDALAQAVAQKIEICTVAVGSFNFQNLQDIAKLTGGIFAETKEISHLYSAMKIAMADKYVARTMIAPRPVMDHDWVYSLMRVSFLLILGFLLFCIKTCLMRTNLAGIDVPLAKIFAANYIPVVVSAFLMEWMVNRNRFRAQLILSLCFTAAFSFKADAIVSDYEDPMENGGAWDTEGENGNSDTFHF